MNNNMPNNFNNGLGNSDPLTNNISNPMVDRANEQLVGGQSSVGNGPSVMQGMPNVQNERGVMQGMAGVSNGPGIMQGQGAPINPSVNQNVVMPGQVHSGINSQTMQVETPKNDNPGIVSIPGFDTPPASNPVPNPSLGNGPVVNQGVSQVMQNTVSTPSINNEVKIPNMINSQNSVNTSVNESVSAPVNNPSNLQNSGNVNLGLNNVGSSPLNSGLSNNPVNSEMPKTQPVMENGPKLNQNSGIVSPNNDIPKTSIISDTNNTNVNTNTNVSSGIVTPNASVNKEVNSSIGIKPTNIGSGLSQVGQTEMNSSSQMGYQEPPKKKFPLSVREMVLIGIALVGIIVVIIMYA